MDNGSHPDQIGEDFELEVTTILPEITLQIIGSLMYKGYRPEDIVTDDLIGDSRSIKNRTIIFKYKGNDLFDDDHKPEDVSSVKKLRNLVIKQFHVKKMLIIQNLKT